MQLFIDTNVLLSFFHFSKDDLEELNKLIVLLEQKRITVLLPDQVQDEFLRNREKKLSEAMKYLKDHNLNLNFPQICRQFEEYGDLRNLLGGLQKKHDELTNKLKHRIQSRTLRADNTVQRLFDLSKKIPRSKEILFKSKMRHELGNPPGKNNSLGDAVNWETLLSESIDGEDLYFVSDDKDYSSPLDDGKMLEFLVSEWREKKNSEIYFYRRLSVFFAEHYPEIRLAKELEKDILIQLLAGSGSFTKTHSVIAQLARDPEFSSKQVSEIVKAVIINDQVRWIFSDDDVFSFITSVTKDRIGELEPSDAEELLKLIKAAKESTV
jgi:predicted nucleic acid-binding protein